MTSLVRNIKSPVMRAILILGLGVFPSHKSFAEDFCKFDIPKDLSGVDAFLAKMSQECMPIYERVNECLLRADVVSSSVVDFHQFFFASQPSKVPFVNQDITHGTDWNELDFDVIRNFKSIEMDHIASLEKIEAFYTEGVEIKGDIAKQLYTLERRYESLLEDLKALSLKESRFFSYYSLLLSKAEDSYEKLIPELKWLSGDSCKEARLSKGLAKMKESAGITLKTVAGLTSYISEIRRARDRLQEYAYKNIRFQMETIYRDKISQDLDRLTNSIDAFIAINRISNRFESWFLTAQTDRRRKNVETRYLQYQASIDMHTIDLNSVQTFEQALRDQGYYGLDESSYLKDRLATAKEYFQRKIDRIQEGGWQGMLARQKVLTAKRLEMGEHYAGECILQLQRYEDLANEVETFIQYKGVELKYKRMMEICKL